MARLVKARCPRCGTNVNARSQNYLEYWVSWDRHGMPCLHRILHIVTLVLVFPFWIGLMVAMFFTHGTRYFCVECGDRLNESDIVI
jgi:predicted RNA-binding Zn-ribbon protein involved in translation (DUF1610 family)